MNDHDRFMRDILRAMSKSKNDAILDQLLDDVSKYFYKKLAIVGDFTSFGKISESGSDLPDSDPLDSDSSSDTESEWDTNTDFPKIDELDRKEFESHMDLMNHMFSLLRNESHLKIQRTRIQVITD